MKLNKQNRELFITSVMNDVPEFEYQEQLQKIIEQDMIDSAPKEIKAALKCKVLRPLLIDGTETWAPSYTIRVGELSANRHNLKLSSIAICHTYVPSVACVPKIIDVYGAALKYHLDRSALRAQVTGAIEGCTTLKIAQERLPEFVKYLPVEAEKSAYLPAIANLAAELCKAGWPKDKKAKSSKSSVTADAVAA